MMQHFLLPSKECSLRSWKQSKPRKKLRRLHLERLIELALRLAPGLDLGMVTTEQYFGYLQTAEVLGPGILRKLDRLVISLK
jgi:hypothetical protein